MRNDEDCFRPAPPQVAVNVVRARPLFDAAARCRSRFNPPSAYRLVVPTTHAICFEHLCAVRPSGGLTRDEEAEERRGEGSSTPVGPGCYQDADCPIEGRYTHFPRGATDVHGDEWCPVCERPGEALPDEAARAARLLSATRLVSTLKVDSEDGPLEPAPQPLAACPALSCRLRTPKCLQRVCSTEVPPRAPRSPVSVARFALGPEPEAPPPPPAPVVLPAGPSVACTNPRDCVMAPIDCSCGSEEPLNRRSAAERARTPMPACTRPCAQRAVEDTITRSETAAPSPQQVTCFRSVCVTPEQRADFVETQKQRAALTAPWNAYLVAHRRWEAQKAAVEADLERAAERE